jgi:hypothetical protein
MWKILHFVPEHAAHDAINAFCNDKRGPGGGGKKRESLVDLMQKHYDEAAALRLKQQGMPSKPLSHPAILGKCSLVEPVVPDPDRSTPLQMVFMHARQDPTCTLSSHVDPPLGDGAMQHMSQR